MTAALLIGGEEADFSLAEGVGFGASGAGTFMLLMSAAAAETAVTHHSPMSLQAAAPAYHGGSLSGLFQSGGWLGGFAAGFLGCGLLGLLFGRGLVGQLGSIPSYFGLAFQVALWAMLCRLIWTRWRGGDAAGAGTLSPRQLADPYLRSRDDLHGGRDRSARRHDTTAPDTSAPNECSPEVTDPGGECR
jgi:predicted lipid-binding transport protein (Tim44 family)